MLLRRRPPPRPSLRSPSTTGPGPPPRFKSSAPRPAENNIPGVTFCREALTELSGRRAEIESTGTRLALVHMTTPESFARFTAPYGLSDLPALADPDRQLYRAIGLQRGTLRQLLGLQVWLRGAKSFFSGHRAGLPEGDPTQMPGAFLLHHAQILKTHRHTNAAQQPDYPALARLPAP